MNTHNGYLSFSFESCPLCVQIMMFPCLLLTMNETTGDGDQVLKAVDILNEMNRLGVHPNEITYSVLFVACER